MKRHIVLTTTDENVSGKAYETSVFYTSDTPLPEDVLDMLYRPVKDEEGNEMPTSTVYDCYLSDDKTSIEFLFRQGGDYVVTPVLGDKSAARYALTVEPETVNVHVDKQPSSMTAVIVDPQQSYVPGDDITVRVTAEGKLLELLGDVAGYVQLTLFSPSGDEVDFQDADISRAEPSGEVTFTIPTDGAEGEWSVEISPPINGVFEDPEPLTFIVAKINVTLKTTRVNVSGLAYEAKVTYTSDTPLPEDVLNVIRMNVCDAETGADQNPIMPIFGP